MKTSLALTYPGSAEAAEAVQRQLAARIVLRRPPEPRRVAGAVLREAAGRRWAAAALLTFPDLTLVDWYAVPADCADRYQCGLRAFHEGQPLLRALLGLRTAPDFVFVRGHGICHPRRCGLASHIGLALERPTAGCAEALLCGRAGSPGPARGDWEPVELEGDVVGAALRMRGGAEARPLYVSPGHLCDVESAVEVALACAPRFRLPEPLRAARMVAADPKAAE